MYVARLLRGILGDAEPLKLPDCVELSNYLNMEAGDVVVQLEYVYLDDVPGMGCFINGTKLVVKSLSLVTWMLLGDTSCEKSKLMRSAVIVISGRYVFAINASRLS